MKNPRKIIIKTFAGICLFFVGAVTGAVIALKDLR